MNLDEAIQSFKDEMEKQTALGHSEHIDNLEQMSEWLKELKAYKVGESRSENPNTCGDAVSRAIVQEEITKSIELKENPYQLWYRIRALPSVIPQQRTGRWIEVIDEIDSLGNKTWHHECSICGSDKSSWGTYKHCPDCGTKMEVEDS